MKKKIFSAFLAIGFALLLLVFPARTNAAGETVHLTVRHEAEILFDGAVTIPEETDIAYTDTATGLTSTSTLTTSSVLAALVAADGVSSNFAVSDLRYYASFNDYLVQCLTIASTGSPACGNWKYVVNGTYSPVGMSRYMVSENDTINVYFGDRYQLVANTSTVIVGETLTATLEEYNYATNVWEGASGQTLIATDPILPDYSNFPPTLRAEALTESDGNASFTFTASGTYYITLPNDYWPGVVVEVEEAPPLTPPTRLIIRYADQFIFDDMVTIPDVTTISYHDSGAADTLTTTTAHSSVLALLLAADAMSDAFAVSDLAYYPNFSSFILNCLDIASETPAAPACYSWQYVVNNAYPSVGMDQAILTSGETVYVYFSNPWSLTADPTTVAINASTTISTWRYQYDNLAEPLALDPHTEITISIPNPAPTGWWDATIPFATTTTDGTGRVDYSFAVAGIYYAQISAPDFSKWSDPVTLTVIETAPTPPSTGGSSGPSTLLFNVPSAIQFLSHHQATDGSIEGNLFTDWAAIAAGAVNPSSGIATALKHYYLADPNALVTGNLTTDYARRAMALMALGIHPYNGTATNYIDRIVDQFDGTQFGDATLVNDDMFALIALLNAGYTATDSMIASTGQFIVAHQSSNGSWVGTDVTAASIQALTLVRSLPGVPEALTRARAYLATKQGADASFEGNVYSTGWALQAIAALGESESQWRAANGRLPSEYLASKQLGDGGLDVPPPGLLQDRVWATSYAIPGILGKTWDAAMQNFSRPSNNSSSASTEPAPTNPTPVPISTPDTVSPSTTEALLPVATDGVGGPGPLDNTHAPEVAQALPVAIIPPLHISTSENPMQEATVEPLALATSETTIVIPEAVMEQNEAADDSASAEALSAPGDVVPTNQTARDIFAGALALAGSLGAYLVWRLAQTLL